MCGAGNNSGIATLHNLEMLDEEEEEKRKNTAMLSP